MWPLLCIGVADPDTHYFWGLDPYQSEMKSKIRIQIRIRVSIYNLYRGSKWKLLTSHNEGVDAQKGTERVCIDQWLQIRITVMRNRLGSGSSEKSNPDPH